MAKLSKKAQAEHDRKVKESWDNALAELRSFKTLAEYEAYLYKHPALAMNFTDWSMFPDGWVRFAKAEKWDLDTAKYWAYRAHTRIDPGSARQWGASVYGTQEAPYPTAFDKPDWYKRLEKAERALPKALTWGKVYGGEGPHYQTDTGELVTMYRKGQKVRFYTEDGRQIGPEQSNVAPAVFAANAADWIDLSMVRHGMAR